MSEIKNIVANAIKNMSMLGDDFSRVEFEKKAKTYTYKDWEDISTAKVLGVGIATGIIGGPVGLALEAADTAYLFSMAGRACYGVGHILGKEVNYDEDLNGILAIWSGLAEASSQIAVGKIGIKIAGKSGLKIGIKVEAKALEKSVLKSGTKVFEKIVAKCVGKITAKYATKISTKWIPIVGGLVSGGINYWVVQSLMDSAKEYYSNDYIVFNDDIANEL